MIRRTAPGSGRRTGIGGARPRPHPIAGMKGRPRASTPRGPWGVCHRPGRTPRNRGGDGTSPKGSRSVPPPGGRGFGGGSTPTRPGRWWAVQTRAPLRHHPPSSWSRTAPPPSARGRTGPQENPALPPRRPLWPRSLPLAHPRSQPRVPPPGRGRDEPPRCPCTCTPRRRGRTLVRSSRPRSSNGSTQRFRSDQRSVHRQRRLHYFPPRNDRERTERSKPRRRTRHPIPRSSIPIPALAPRPLVRRPPPICRRPPPPCPRSFSPRPTPSLSPGSNPGRPRPSLSGPTRPRRWSSRTPFPRGPSGGRRSRRCRCRQRSQSNRSRGGRRST
mmetsp:Transcript_20322/g.58744  ORF Transcript_20322/g.58744 Transcript_20322/m.58744 type:complete len:329 (-) Transcript_20322:1415-2401(-)